VVDERRRIAHLYRRAAFGATRDELDRLTKLGYESAVDELLDDTAAAPVEPAALGIDLATDPKVADLQRAWLGLMVKTDRPLREKMVLFWHGLLTSGAPKVREHAWLWRQNDLFRRHALGNYGQLLLEVGRDPAMLRWLDGDQSRKRHPNENYARELIELFSMGIGNYGEDDVKEAARAFTGWTVDKTTGQVALRPAQFDAGTKTVLGKTGPFDDAAVVQVILGQAATPRFVARKLLAFFHLDAPEPDFVERIGGVLESSGYELKPALRALFLAPEFGSDAVQRAKVKSPTEFAVGVLRHLRLDGPPNGIGGAMQQMGQELFAPPNVAGWPGGSRGWVSTSMLLARFNAARAALGRANLSLLTGGTPDDARDRLIEHFLEGDATTRLRGVVRDWLAAHGTAAAGVRGAAHLVLSSPTYQMA
jgi:uncharacterized protein (DUF1800 family)